MSERVALPFLLWSVFRKLEQSYNKQRMASPDMPSLDLWANLLRALTETETDQKALPSTLCLSGRAVRMRLATAFRRGWAQGYKHEGRTGVALTARGSEIACQWPPLQEQAEKRWQTEIGATKNVRTERLRTSLIRIVARFPLEHPHYPASYGAADASITGGNGQDWKPVSRTDASAVARLPFSALLSQAIVAFAIDYERMSPVALSLSTAIIRRIPAEGRSVRELANPAGVSALERHGFLSVRGTRASGIAFLTPRGIAVSESYDQRVESVEGEWCKQFGNEPVAWLRHSLEAVTSAHRERPSAVSGE